MKFLMWATIGMCGLLSSAYAEDFLVGESERRLASSSTNPFTLGQLSHVSDIRVSSMPPLKRFDDFSLAKDSHVNRIVWTGSNLPHGVAASALTFEISFYEDVRVPVSNGGFTNLPVRPAFARYIVTPEIREADVEFSRSLYVDNFSVYGVNLDAEVFLESGRRYWISIALVDAKDLPGDYLWRWVHANGLLFSAIENTSTGMLENAGFDLHFLVFGRLFDPMADGDEDGIFDLYDECLATPPTLTVDHTGCAAMERDSDNDGYTDDIDFCPGTKLGEIPDSNGCSANQRDSDNDGVWDAWDNCPLSDPGMIVDIDGC